MPSAKQIKARKAFAKKYAKKGKRKATTREKQVRKKYDKLTKSEKTELEKRMHQRKYKTIKETLDPDYDAKWDKKMQEFLNRTNNES